jgi:hypothetical protein
LNAHYRPLLTGNDETKKESVRVGNILVGVENAPLLATMHQRCSGLRNVIGSYRRLEVYTKGWGGMEFIMCPFHQILLRR